jgi:hypothetical protein
MSDPLDDQNDLRAALLAEYKPRGPTEMTVFDQLAHSAWVLQRLRGIQLQGADPKTMRALDRLERYRDHHRRMYEKALAWLRKLQTERAVKNPRDLASARQEAPLADPQRIERALRRSRPRRRPAVDLAKLPPATNLIQ